MLILVKYFPYHRALRFGSPGGKCGVYHCQSLFQTARWSGMTSGLGPRAPNSVSLHFVLPFDVHPWEEGVLYAKDASFPGSTATRLTVVESWEESFVTDSFAHIIYFIHFHQFALGMICMRHRSPYVRRPHHIDANSVSHLWPTSSLLPPWEALITGGIRGNPSSLRLTIRSKSASPPDIISKCSSERHCIYSEAILFGCLHYQTQTYLKILTGLFLWHLFGQVV